MADRLGDVFITVIPTMKGSQNSLGKEIRESLGSQTDKAADEAGGRAGPKLGKKLGTTAMAAFAGLGFGAMLSQAITQGLELESATSKISAQLALTGEESAKAGRVAGALWADAYGETASDTAKATGAIMSSVKGMRTASEAEIQAMTGKAMSLAEAFDLDVSQAAQAAGQMIHVGMAQNGTQAFDLLAASLTKVPEAMRGDVVDAANEYGGYLHDLGLTGEQAMGALVAASAGGTIAIDKTGDALKELSIRATDMSASSVAAYQAAGLNAEEMAAKFLAGGDEANEAMNQLVAGLLSIKDPTEQANAAIALFGTPLEDIGVAKIPQFLQGLSSMDSALGDVTGAATRLDTQLNDNTATSLEGFKRSFIDAIAQGMQPFLAAAKPLLDFAREHPILIQIAAAAFLALAAGLAVAAAAQWVMNAALLANPLTWVVVAIMAVIAALVLLWNNSETFRNFFIGLWEGIKTVVGAVVDWFKGPFLEGLSATWEAVKSGAQALVDWFSSAWNSISTSTQTAWNAVVSIISSVWAQIGPIITVPLQLWQTMIGAAWEAIKTIFSTALAVITALLNGNLSEASAALSAGWESIKGIFATTWEAIKGIFTNAFAAVSQIVQTAWTQIVNYFTTSFGKVQNVVTTAWAKVKNLFVSSIAAIVALVATLPGKATSALSSIGAKIIGVITRAWNGFKAATTRGINSAISLVRQLPGKAASALGRAGSVLVGAGRALVNGFLSGIRSTWGRVTSYVSGAMSRLRGLWPFSPAKWGPFSGKGYVTYSGEALTQDFADSIAGGAPLAEEAAIEVMEAATVRPKLAVADPITNLTTQHNSEEAGKPGLVVNGPLVHVEGLTVRDDDDIRKISQQLQDGLEAKTRAMGKTTLGI